MAPNSTKWHPLTVNWLCSPRHQKCSSKTTNDNFVVLCTLQNYFTNCYSALYRLICHHKQAKMVCGRPSSCYGLRDAWKFQDMPTEQRALDQLAVSKHDARLLWRFLTFWPFHLKNGTPLTRASGNAYANFDLSTFFCFQVRNSCGTDRQTDRRMGKTLNVVYGLMDEFYCTTFSCRMKTDLTENCPKQQAYPTQNNYYRNTCM